MSCYAITIPSLIQQFTTSTFRHLLRVTRLQLGQVDPTELRLGRPTASHRTCRTDPSGSSHQHRIGILGTGPSLMLDDLASIGDLLFLDHVGVRLHTVCGERLGESVRDEGVGVKTSEGDELPAARARGGGNGQQPTISICYRPSLDSHESQSTQLPHVFLHILIVETSASPVERRRQVVSQPVSRSFGVNTIGKLFSLSVDGRFSFHPQEI